jgi:amino acid transporter
MPERDDTKGGPETRLGTFAGVFTPSVLTILGIILFLRLGYVVGQAGIVRALIIILMANAISVLTSVSLSAIATNLRVKGGGDYYVISRTLGVEAGGALGLVLYLAQSVSIAFYAIGFGEAVAAMFPGAPGRLPQVVAAAAVAALFVLAWLGADWATRFQYVVMAVLFAAIVVFFAGGLPAWNGTVFADNVGRSGNVPFWAVFAIFFPAVTGFTQGVSMSGDLKDPGKSLPRGTFAAVFLSMVIYVGVALVFAGAVSGDELASDYKVMRRVAALPWLIDAGVIAATLSSALASFLGAPRILQSLAADRVFPFLTFFAAGHGPSNNPRRGVLLSLGIALGTVGLGDLNVVAPVVSMFFLISYGLLNYATYVEAKANSPYFRPRFRWFHQRWSLLGGLACLGAMLAIQPLAAAVAVVLLFSVYQYIARTVSIERWADSDRSHRFQRVRDDLHAISRELEHQRDWRPVVLAFSDDPGRRLRLLRFAEWLEGRAGFTTSIRLVRGEGPKTKQIQRDAEEELRTEINRHELPAFAKVIVTPDLAAALPVVLQAHGLGRVRANTALVNWYENSDESVADARSRAMRVALRLGVNLVMLSADEPDFDRIEEPSPGPSHIDVWYRDNASGRVMLMMAYLMTRSPTWKDGRIRVMVARKKDEDEEQTLQWIEERLEDYRIDAEAVIVERIDARAILEHSSDSPMVFLPFRLSDRGVELIADADIGEVARVLGIVALVLAAADLELDAEPESGKHADIAEAVDAASKTKLTLQQIEKEVAKVESLAQRAEAELREATETRADPEQLESLRKEHKEASEQLEQLKRRGARARVKAETSARQADTLTGRSGNGDKDPGG